MESSHSALAQDFRRKAASCDTLASCARSDADRAQLLRMRDTCLQRAATEDWLGGLPPLPPANAAALPVTHG